MIDWVQAVVLALIQGLTEFLPISSSAHLVIPSLLLDWPDQGLAFDIAVHVGTLTAVVLYYRRDLKIMVGSWCQGLLGGGASEESRTVWYLLFATIPAGLVGLFQQEYIENELRVLPVIAATTLFFGLLLGLADRYARMTPGSRELDFGMAMLIGLAQALAPVPGVSRSGVTITAGLLLNMSRQDAARFSFLLSIPIIACAGVLKTWEFMAADAAFNWRMMVLGAVVSGITAYLCIALFLRLLDRVGMMPFVYYRILLAIVLFCLWLV